MRKLVAVDAFFAEIEGCTRGFAPETELGVAVSWHGGCGGSACKGDGRGEDCCEMHVGCVLNGSLEDESRRNVVMEGNC